MLLQLEVELFALRGVGVVAESGVLGLDDVALDLVW